MTLPSSPVMPPTFSWISYVRAFVFYCGYVLLTLFHAPLCLVVCPFLPFKGRHLLINVWSLFVIHWVWVTCGVRYQVIGRDNIPKHTAFVVISNHQSQWETFYLQLLFVPLITVLKKEIMSIPFFGWALNLLNPIIIDRSQKQASLGQILEQGKRRLAEGWPVLIFPEGTRKHGVELSSFSRGGFLLATEAGVPVISIAHNAGKLWPPHQFCKTPGLITLVISPPMTGVVGESDALKDASHAWVQQQLTEMKR